MNAAANLANDLPVMIIIALWWVLLSVADLMFPHRDFGGEPGSARPHGASVKVTGAVDDGTGAIRKLDPNFAFLTGGANACETIRQACGQGDTRPLLSPIVLEAFANAIAEPPARQETLALTFVAFDDTPIMRVEVSAQAIEIDVLSIAQIVSVTRSPLP